MQLNKLTEFRLGRDFCLGSVIGTLSMVNRHLFILPQEKSCDDLEATTEALIQANLVGLGQRLPKAPRAPRFYCKGGEMVRGHAEKAPRGSNASSKGFCSPHPAWPRHRS